MKADMLSGPRCELRREDPDYPQSLREIPDPPECLFVVGDVGALQPGLAVVGARKATPYGLGCARRFARIAAEKGVAIISGGARGCDSEAHRAALDANGRTVVFLGGGCDCIYPPEHAGLFQRVVDRGGAVVSENPWGFKPKPYTFRMRNRLIAGLADAVLIVEAGLPSGTFSTADEALTAGKEVLVVPGAITSSTSRGANRLLFQGALPVVDDETFEDVLLTVFGALKRPQETGVDRGGQDESPLISAILATPMSSDEVYRLAEELYGEAHARSRMMHQLAEAEAEGSVARLRDGRWGPRVRG